jgi:cytochrome P450
MSIERSDMVSVDGQADERASELYWDPFDIQIDTSPYEIWRRLRDEAPVYHNDRFGFFALSRFDDVDAAHRDPATFSSAHGTVLELMTDDPYPDAPLIFLDPPEHTRLRALVSRAFTARRVNELEDRIRQLCTDFLDRQVGSRGFDYLQDFAVRLPSLVISSLFGVPIEEQDDVRHLIDTMFTIEPGVGTMNPTAFQATADLHAYFSSLLTIRLETPTDDMLTALTVAEIKLDDGSVRRLTISEAALFAVMVVSAGTETVARLLGWAAVTLDANPDQRAELARDFSLIPNAVEELLRYEAPSPVQARIATRAVEIHGTVIPEASKVLLLTGSAGRDERQFSDADRFDIHRQFSTHMSFGYGVHFCLGAALARLESRVALEETLRRFPVWEVDHTRAVRLHTSTVRGYSSVPIRI